MFITLPLALIGVGFMIYLLFAAATYMLPIYAGLSAGFAALHAGASYMSALLLGLIAFLFAVMLGQMATQLPSRHARMAVALVFAVSEPHDRRGGGRYGNGRVWLSLAAGKAKIAASKFRSA